MPNRERNGADAGAAGADDATGIAGLDAFNAQDLATAMDALAQRIIATQRAKSKGGSWEKAEAAELLTGTGRGVAAGGLLKLTM